MKNFLLSLVVCILAYLATSFALKKYAEKKSVKNSTTKSIDKKDVSSKNTLNKQTSVTNGKPYTVNVNPAEIENNYKLWREYNTKNIELSYEFTPIDNNNNVIKKEDFIKKLTTGLYIPLKVKNDDKITYKLYKLSEAVDAKIKKSIKSSSLIAEYYFNQEGQTLPEFEFTDLTGNKYSKSSIKGKITVIKCWFIHCVVCVQEFPELNELYDRYEGNDNVAFISLAFDKEDKLKKFLTKKKFRYPVVAKQKDYMTKKLGIKQYPTHIIVDENGRIIKMMNNVNALIHTLSQLVEIQNFDNENNTQEDNTEEYEDEYEDEEYEDEEYNIKQ